MHGVTTAKLTGPEGGTSEFATGRLSKKGSGFPSWASCDS
jgi:hypothetical protein